MYIIETCPKCGADIRRSIFACVPPIEHAECSNPSCDWSWTAKPEEVKRIPFDPKNRDSGACQVATIKAFFDIYEESKDELYKDSSTTEVL